MATWCGVGITTKDPSICRLAAYHFDTGNMAFVEGETTTRMHGFGTIDTMRLLVCLGSAPFVFLYFCFVLP